MKRAFDLVSSLLLLAVLCLPLLVITLLQVIKLGHPIFFRQTRAGRDGRAFKILKVPACVAKERRTPRMGTILT